MAVMEWNDALALDGGVIDETHREFVELLNRMAEAPDDRMLAVIDEFIVHTKAHFAQEQRWMESLDFPPLHCHVDEHNSVMQIAEEVRKRAAAGETRFGPVLAQAVAEWFVNHASSMDAVMSMYMKEKGFEPDRDPVPAPAGT